MEDYESDDVLTELARLCDELGLDHMDSEAMACKTHIFVDASGNPHECWEAGPGHINVAVAMTPEQAVRIMDVMTANARLRELCEGMLVCYESCNEHLDTRTDCPLYDDGEPFRCKKTRLLRELGIKVGDSA